MYVYMCMYMYDMNMYHINIMSYVYDVDKQNMSTIGSHQMKLIVLVLKFVPTASLSVISAPAVQ